MIRLITFSDENMTQSAKVCIESAKANGTDIEYSCVPGDITDEFKNTNKDIFTGIRGTGCYWLFKPYLINKVINISNDGDIIIYSDAGVKWINNVREIISRMDQDIFLFSNGHQHVHWCKADILKSILHKDMIEDSYQQVQASVIFFKVNDYTRRFIKEWLLFAQMPGLIDDSPSKVPNHPGFQENRHDQAILATMAIREGLTLHYWADSRWYHSQRYRWANDNYPLMFDHHRFRNTGTPGNNPTW